MIRLELTPGEALALIACLTKSDAPYARRLTAWLDAAVRHHTTGHGVTDGC